MRAKQLADRLLQYPTFDVKFSLLEPDGSSYGLCLKTFDVDIDDIGYSSEVVRLGPVGKQESNTIVVDPLLKEMAESLHKLLTKVAWCGYDFQLETEFEEGKVVMQKYREQVGE